MPPKLARAVTFLVAGCIMQLSTATAADGPSAPDLASKVEEYMTARVKRDKFSGTVLIARSGQMVFKIDPKLYYTYICQYEADLTGGKGKRQITVSLSSGRLMIRPKDQLKLEAVPESATRFYLRAADALAEFVTGPGGVVNELDMVLGNQRIKASRVQKTAEADAGQRTGSKAQGKGQKAQTAGKAVVPENQP